MNEDNNQLELYLARPDFPQVVTCLQCGGDALEIKSPGGGDLPENLCVILCECVELGGYLLLKGGCWK